MEPLSARPAGTPPAGAAVSCRFIQANTYAALARMRMPGQM